ncbi:MAG: amino acid permease [Desulfovibrio sp.]|nr:amino acid permease [Desulfovibrio sp.]
MPDGEQRLTPYLGPAGAWALSLGATIGWGSLVITSSTYLAQAGPMGSLLGMLAGGLIMLVIARNYHYMMNCCPEAGGAYAYARDCFGHDHGFLVAWFMALTYLAVFWANATALPLFARHFLGDIFRFGRLYTLFGYEIFLGEIVLTSGAILFFAFLCMGSRRSSAALLTVFSLCFTAAIAICFVWSMGSRPPTFNPPYVPDAAILSQVTKIAIMSPWAFIGFEIISHATEEFSFNPTKSFRVLVAAVLTASALYIFITLLSATAWPPQFSSWYAYIKALPTLEGIEGFPAFYAARHYMGEAGIVLLMAALLCLVLSSLVGIILGLSRLFYALAKDGVLPESYARLNGHGVPARAVMLVAAVSLVTVFAGRTAIGWIIEVPTIGATLVYAFVSACAWKQACVQDDGIEKITGAVGVLVMGAFEVYLLVPNLFTKSAIAPESYILFVLWSLLGFIFFRTILKRDGRNHFGRSLIVWISLFSLVLFVSLVWMSQSIMTAASDAMNAMSNYFSVSVDDTGVVAGHLEAFKQVNARSLIVVIALLGLTFTVLLNNYAIIRRKAEEHESALNLAEKKYAIDPLTGVKTRHSFTDRENEINGKMAVGAAGAFALAICDVNGLKHINDTLGHKAGDEYIRGASQMICLLFSHSPVYRMGGDEFAVFLQGVDYENRHPIMQSLHDLCVAHIATGEPVVAAGLADYIEGRDTTLHDVFERADALMYEEKKTLKALGAKTR